MEQTLVDGPDDGAPLRQVRLEALQRRSLRLVAIAHGARHPLPILE